MHPCLEDPYILRGGNVTLLFVLKCFYCMCNPFRVQPFTFLIVIYVVSIYMDTSVFLERSYYTLCCLTPTNNLEIIMQTVHKTN